MFTMAMAGASERAVAEGLWPDTAERIGFVLLVEAYSESGLVERIQMGQCSRRLMECDAYRGPGGRVYFRARGAYQLHNTPLLRPGEWLRVAGTGSDDAASWAAARVLSEGRRRCKHRKGAEVEATIAWYATGGRCYWRPARARAGLVARLEQRFGVVATVE